MKKKQKGFTLVELMIVIAILGILTSYAISNFISYRSKSYCSRVESDARNVLSALSAYFSEPQNSSCGSIDRLTEQAALTLNAGNSVRLIENQNTTPVSYWIYATDGSRRCPRGSYFITVMGSNSEGRWSR